MPMPGKINKYFSRLNLKQRLIMLIVFSILASVLISEYATLTMSKNIIQDKTETMVRNTVGQISQNIDEVLLRRVNDISKMMRYDTSMYGVLLKKYPKSEAGEKEKLLDELMLSNNILEKYITVYDDIKIAAILGKNNVLYNIYFPPPEKNDLVYENVQEIAEMAKKLISNVQWYPLQENYFSGRKTNDLRQNLVVMAGKGIFTAKTQEYLGTCVFTIDENTIFKKYSNIRLGETGYIFIVDSRGGLVSNSNAALLENWSGDRVLLEKISKRTEEVFTYNKDNKSFLVITSESKVNDWITVGMVPIGEVNDEVNKVYRIVFLIAFFTILAAVGSVVIIADRVVKPIRAVVSSMEQVEKGNLDIFVDIKGDYEVSNLAKYFNSMIKRIKQLLQEEHELGKKKKQAELDALMAQINPHFLYNALDSIVWMAKSTGASDISKMASALGKLLRIGINRGKTIVPVAEEVDHVTAYLNVQKIRYKDKFDFVVNITDEKLRSYKTLKLILQPLVENSLINNIGEVDRKLDIEITVREEDKLIIEVMDNGIGMTGEKLEEIQRRIGLYGPYMENTAEDVENHKGIGLKNIQDRIRLYFGDEYGISITSAYQSWTKVYLELPLIEE